MFETREYSVDLCVVGGGIAGMCAAIAAARHGSKVALMQDRPVFGGNASSEIRMWICGAGGQNRRETGIIEEIQLENLYRNPNKVYSIWDSVLWEKIAFEENIVSFMNCSCLDAEMDGATIRSVTGWQLTTQTYHKVSAKYFADCSGDSVLAPLTGAEYRWGRESKEEFDESIEPDEADRRMMGMSCLLQIRELDRPVPFTPPEWAKRFESENDFPGRGLNPRETNFWWIEYPSQEDGITDTEEVKRRLLSAAFGIWDFIKNRSSIPDVENLELDFVGFLPGKRESRRYVGDHVITQNDVSSRGEFEDIVAYGGWSMDDHHPDGLDHPDDPTIFHEAPSPWGIPFRALYSKNVSNLYFAGRNISATHIALASSRVMRTCAIIGQAVGTAASIGIRHDLEPRSVYDKELGTLQQTLMDDDCWLPGLKRKVYPLTAIANITSTSGDPEQLRNGIERPTERNPEDAKRAIIRPPDEGGPAAATPPDVSWNDNAWVTRVGQHVELSWEEPQQISGARVVFDSDLNRYYRDMRMLFGYFKSYEPMGPPATLVKGFRIEYLTEGGQWELLYRAPENRQRLVRIAFGAVTTHKVRLHIEETWGSPDTRVFSLDIV